MDELISIYNSVAKNYLKRLTEYSESKPCFKIPLNSIFKSEKDYMCFRSKSFRELCKVLQNIIEQLDKYNKFKTLNPKIIRLVIINNLTQGEFYDYAIGYYNYKDIEPELFELINNHFNQFFELSKKVETVSKNEK